MVEVVVLDNWERERSQLSYTMVHSSRVLRNVETEGLAKRRLAHSLAMHHLNPECILYA